MKLSSLTYLGFETNAVLDARPSFNIPFSEIHSAAQQRRLVEHLAKRFGAEADLSMILSNPDERIDVESALGEAAECFDDRERRKIGVENNGLNLVLALIFEVIQQKFTVRPPEAAPEPPPAPEKQPDEPKRRSKSRKH